MKKILSSEENVRTISHGRTPTTNNSSNQGKIEIVQLQSGRQKGKGSQSAGATMPSLRHSIRIAANRNAISTRLLRVLRIGSHLR